MHIDLPAFPVEGGCVCGAVRYRVLGTPPAVYNCHCRDCQRLSGSTHTMSMPIGRDPAELIAGELSSYGKPADSGRVVRMRGCPHCGVRVWNEPPAGDIVILKPGTLDDPRWAVPVGNICTNSAMPYAVVDPALVNFPAQPADRQPLYDAWSQATAG